MNRRPAPARQAPGARTHGQPIVVAIRITVNHSSGEPLEVVVHQDASLDDAMWRPDGVDTARSDATVGEASSGVRHPYADVELTAENPAAASRQGRPAATGTTTTSRRIDRTTFVAGAVVIAAILVGVAILRP